MSDDSLVAYGELKGLLEAFAWANHKCNHFSTFTVERLPAGTDLLEILSRHFGENAAKIATAELADWPATIEESFRRFLFEYVDVIKPNHPCALADERCHREIIASLSNKLALGLQPLTVWRVTIEPNGFYELYWDDFAIQNAAGWHLLHLGFA